MAEIPDKIKERTSLTFVYVASILLNAILLVLWVAVQFGVVKVISFVKTDSLTDIVILTFRVIFAISTLAPIAIRLFTDIRIMLIQSNKEIKQELQA